MLSVPHLPARIVARVGPDDVELQAAAWRRDVRLRALERVPHEPQRASHRRRWAWLCAIAVHVIVMVGLRVSLRRQELPATDADVIEVELIETPLAPAPAESPPLPRPAAPRPRVAPLAANPPDVSAPPLVADAPAAEAPALDQLRLFNPDGSLTVPDDLAARISAAKPRPNFIARDYSPSPIMQTKRPLKMRPNHFAKYWTGSDGKPLHQTFFENLTVTREFTAPWGGRYGCAWILIIVACADVPDKPWIAPTTWKPATEQDEY